MAIKKSMARNFLLLNYHAFVAIHPANRSDFFNTHDLFTSTVGTALLTLAGWSKSDSYKAFYFRRLAVEHERRVLPL